MEGQVGLLRRRSSASWGGDSKTPSAPRSCGDTPHHHLWLRGAGASLHLVPLAVLRRGTRRRSSLAGAPPLLQTRLLPSDSRLVQVFLVLVRAEHDSCPCLPRVARGEPVLLELRVQLEVHFRFTGPGSQVATQPMPCPRRAIGSPGPETGLASSQFLNHQPGPGRFRVTTNSIAAPRSRCDSASGVPLSKSRSSAEAYRAAVMFNWKSLAFRSSCHPRPLRSWISSSKLQTKR